MFNKNKRQLINSFLALRAGYELAMAIASVIRHLIWLSLRLIIEKGENVYTMLHSPYLWAIAPSKGTLCTVNLMCSRTLLRWDRLETRHQKHAKGICKQQLHYERYKTCHKTVCYCSLNMCYRFVLAIAPY